MADHATTVLQARPREPSGSRSARRLRRTGDVPGIVYGGGEEPVAFAIGAHELRRVLADAGALFEFRLAGAAGTPVVLKELARHPVSGEAIHIDLLRVRLDRPIQAPVAIELMGVDEAAGTREGGILEQPLREVTVEALPAEIPDSIKYDVSAMRVNDTVTLAVLEAPPEVTIITDPETVLATITPPRLRVEAGTEIETETEVVGEGEAAEAAVDEAEGGAEGGAGGQAAPEGESSGGGQRASE
jgi:large subunit ribosomal protein L25